MQRATRIWITAGAVMMAGIGCWFLFGSRLSNVGPIDAVTAGESQTSSALVKDNLDIRNTPLSRPIKTNEDPEQAAYLQWKESIAEALIVNGDADSLAAAASILYSLRSVDRQIQARRIVSLLERASLLAPADASIQSLALVTCQTLPECNPSQFATALRAADPQNSLVWANDAANAIREKDNAAIRVAVENIAKGQSVKSYFTENVLRVSHAVESVRVAPPKEISSPNLTSLRDTVALEFLRAQQLPPIIPLLDACGSADMAMATGQCLKAGAIMEQSDSLLVQMIGLRLELQAAKPDSADAQRITVAVQKLNWLTGNLRALSFNTDPEKWIRLMEQNHSESDVMRQLLIESGMPPEPPTRSK